MLTDERLREIETRITNATPGPWHYTPGVLLKHYVDAANGDFHIGLQSQHWKDGHEIPAEANARFIAHARTDLPDLLATYRAQRERIAALEAMLRGMEWTPLVDAIDGEDLTACPVCGQRKAWGHASDCGLAALLKEAQV
jgi:hypothetical protein